VVAVNSNSPAKLNVVQPPCVSAKRVHYSKAARSDKSNVMLMNQRSVTWTFVAGAAATAVIAAPMAAAVWADAVTGSSHTTTYADPGPPGCLDLNEAACGSGNASVSIPGANASAGPGQRECQRA
jgi:hypothetical protein